MQYHNQVSFEVLSRQMSWYYTTSR